MARRNRKRAGKDRLDGSPNHQEAQEQPTEVNAEKPLLLYPETESTLPKDPEIKMVEEKEVKKIEGEERNEPNQLGSEPDSTTRKETIRKSANNMESENHELCPKLDPLSPKDSNPVLLPEQEPAVVKNETNGLSTEPDSTTPSKKKRKKRKGKSLFTSEGAETNHVQSEHREFIPNLDTLSPKDPDPVLLPPEPEPVVVKSETNGLSTEPNSTTPRKKKGKGKGKSLSTSERTETNNVHSDHRELIPNLDPLDPVLLPELEPVAEKNETNQLCTEAESAAPRRKKRKGKGKSLSTSERTETNNVHSEHRELIPNLDPLDPVLLPELVPVAEKNETNQLCTEPESATPRRKKRKGKGKNLSTSEGTETNNVHSEQRELIPNLDPLSQKDSDPVLLPEPEPFAEKSETNQLSTEPESATPRKKKRRGKGKSLSASEGTETNDVLSDHRELMPILDPLPSKDSESVLLPEPEPVVVKNDTNQLCIEPESTPSRNMKRKRKRKSLSKSEGVEANHVDSEYRELCPNLATLPVKGPDALLLPEPSPVGENNLELCPKLDPLPPRDSDPLLLTESEPAPLKVVEQKKKRKKKKKKNKGKLEGEGVESNRPNDEHSQQCHKAKPTTPEERNQRKRKRKVVNETHNSSLWSMVTPNYNLRPLRASILDSEVAEAGPRVPKMPLKYYERYEVCKI